MNVEIHKEIRETEEREKHVGFFHEICEDYSRIKVVSEKVLIEIERRVESATSLHEYYGFLSSHVFKIMSTTDL